jgi:hypothetical protein
VVASKPKPKPKPKYVYAEDLDDQLYLINGRYYKNQPMRSYRPNYALVEDDYVEEYPEERMVYRTPRYNPPTERIIERVVVLDNNSNPRDKITPRIASVEPRYEQYLDDEPLYEYSGVRDRVYAPVKSRSVEYLPARRTAMEGEPIIHYSPPKRTVVNKNFKKPNHRREVDEPQIRDKPILNKPVIHGGAVVYK